MERPAANPRRSDRPARTVAVVLCAPGEPPPRALLEALARRRVEAVLAGDPFRAIRALAGAAITGKAPPALIVVEPPLHRSASAGDLLHAVRTRFSGVALWRFDPHARPPLRAMPSAMFSDQGKAPEHRSNGSAHPPVSHNGPHTSKPPALRLTPRAPDAPDAPTPDHDDAPAPPSALLSEEELTMLLSDDFDPPSTR